MLRLAIRRPGGAPAEAAATMGRLLHLSSCAGGRRGSGIGKATRLRAAGSASRPGAGSEWRATRAAVGCPGNRVNYRLRLRAAGAAWRPRARPGTSGRARDLPVGLRSPTVRRRAGGRARAGRPDAPGGRRWAATVGRRAWSWSASWSSVRLPPFLLALAALATFFSSMLHSFAIPHASASAQAGRFGVDGPDGTPARSSNVSELNKA